MSLFGPVNIVSVLIMSLKYSMQFFVYGRGGEEGDSPLIDLLGFAAGNKTKVRAAEVSFRQRLSFE